MLTTYELGMRGQKTAEEFLVNKGYKILEQNYRLRSGEIDLIAEYGSYKIFVEVKFRRSANFGSPAEAVGYVKQKKIINTASHYAYVKKLDNQDLRFDIIEVTETYGKISINHIENAFGLS